MGKKKRESLASIWLKTLQKHGRVSRLSQLKDIWSFPSKYDQRKHQQCDVSFVRLKFQAQRIFGCSIKWPFICLVLCVLASNRFWLGRFFSFHQQFLCSARGNMLCSSLSRGEKQDDTVLWETCEGFNMFQIPLRRERGGSNGGGVRGRGTEKRRVRRAKLTENAFPSGRRTPEAGGLGDGCLYQ